MPEFDCLGSLDDSYTRLLFALGLLSEDAPGVTRKAAECELQALIARYTLCGMRFEVGPEKYENAAFFLGLAREKQTASFKLTVEDLSRFFDYMTTTTLDEAKAEPGKHAAVDIVVNKQLGTVVCAELRD